jgi:predicted DNA-binding transcriptional regulator AlpA
VSALNKPPLRDRILAAQLDIIARAIASGEPIGVVELAALGIYLTPNGQLRPLSDKSGQPLVPPPPIAEPPLLSGVEIASLVGRVPRTISRWVAAGTFPAPVRRGLWRRTDIDWWLKGGGL